MYDIIIVGAGPAGLTAAIYARRAEKSVLVIEKDTFGGQITHSPRVENIPGFLEVSGNEFADKLIEQAMEQGAEIELDTVTGIGGEEGNYTVICGSKEYRARSVIVATGSRHRTLGIANEERYTGEGISYCAVCDGAFFRGKSVAVIGGGNSALQDAVMLSESCPKVYVVQNLEFLTGEKKLQKILAERENVEFIYNSVVKRIIADGSELRGIVIADSRGGGEMELRVDGVFVAIGQVPENEPFKAALKLNDYGYVVAGEGCVPEAAEDGTVPRGGIFVAGDCRTKSVRQVTTATADGAVAAIAACRFIDSLDRE
ncbi:MAG: FAD-dependent oxidoreductase [Clostridia bacterium]|nr:FAD-dependent oxidoreductase [Clostridia bacterium]